MNFNDALKLAKFSLAKIGSTGRSSEQISAGEISFGKIISFDNSSAKILSGKWFIFLCVTIFITSFAKATERRSFYSGIRCQAMGGACIAVTNDETSLLINPAGLGKLRDFFGTVFDPELELNANGSAMYSSSSFSNPFDLENIKSSLDTAKGKYYHAKAQVFPSFVGPNFGIGLYGNYLLDARMDAAGTSIDTYFRSDYALALGFNFRFFDGRVKLGLNAKLIDRAEISNAAVSATGPYDFGSLGTNGLGLSTDVGLIMTAPWTYLPTIAAVLRDVGGTSFASGAGMRASTTNRPAALTQDLDVALALFPIHSNYLRGSWTVEYRGLLTASQIDDPTKLMHGGFELNVGDVLFLRAGYNQRYWTAGLEIASERFQWQIASYGEEIGTLANHEEDRRYIAKFAYRY